MTDLRHPSDRESPIREEFGAVPHRRYSATTLLCDIPNTLGPHPFSISFPIEISLYAASTIIKETMEGDQAELHIGEPTQVAVNVQPVSVDDDLIYVNSTEHFDIGFWVSIDDGVNNDELGRVLEIDSVANTIRVETAAAHAFAAMTPVKIQMKMAHDLTFAGSGAVNFGQAMIGGTPIPANAPICIHYTNNQGDAKKMMLLLEYRY